MNENTAKYIKMVKNNLERVMIGLLVVLLGVVAFFWYSEQSSPPREAGTGKVTKLEEVVTANAKWKTIANITEAPTIASYPSIAQVATFDMFDFKSVKAREQVEREAKQNVKLAQDALAAGRKDEARAIIEKVLGSFPTLQEARDLKAKLEGAEPKPSPTPATPPRP